MNVLNRLSSLKKSSQRRSLALVHLDKCLIVRSLKASHNEHHLLFAAVCGQVYRKCGADLTAHLAYNRRAVI